MGVKRGALLKVTDQSLGPPSFSRVAGVVEGQTLQTCGQWKCVLYENILIDEEE